VAFSPDGRSLAASGTPGGVILWRLRAVPPAGGHGPRLSLDRPVRLSAQPSKSLCFHPDGHLLAWAETSPGTNHEGALRVWDLEAGSEHPFRLSHPAGAILSIAFRPDGKELVRAGRDGEVEVWDIATRQRLLIPMPASLTRKAPGPGAIVALSSDGKWLAQQAIAARVWDLEGRALLLLLPQEQSTPYCVGLSPNKEHLAVGTSDGGLVLWNLPAIRSQLAEIGLGW